MSGCHPYNYDCGCPDKLKEEIIELRTRIEALHEHKLRQIDENRKISRRVDELEQAWRECNEANPIKMIIDRFENLEAKFADFMQKSSLKDEKRPFECPVCSGNRKIQGQQFSSNYQCTTFYDCLACDGSGIVWS